MKPVSILVSFAIGAAAQASQNGMGNIRAARILREQQAADGDNDKMSSLSQRDGKDANAYAAARHDRSRRKVAGDGLHEAIIKNMGLTINMKTQDIKEGKEDRELNDKVRKSNTETNTNEHAKKQQELTNAK